MADTTRPAGDWSFRRLTRDDFGMLAGWLAHAHVKRWWHHEHSPEAVEADFGPSIDGTDPGHDYVAALDGRPIGLVQFAYFRDYPDYADDLGALVDGDGIATVDYLVGEPTDTGRGVGRGMLRAFVESVWETYPDVSALVVPVHADNVASWTALRAAGFAHVATVELEPDNPADGPLHHVHRLDRPST